MFDRPTFARAAPPAGCPEPESSALAAVDRVLAEVAGAWPAYRRDPMQVTPAAHAAVRAAHPAVLGGAIALARAHADTCPRCLAPTFLVPGRDGAAPLQRCTDCRWTLGDLLAQLRAAAAHVAGPSGVGSATLAALLPTPESVTRAPAARARRGARTPFWPTLGGGALTLGLAAAVAGFWWGIGVLGLRALRWLAHLLS